MHRSESAGVSSGSRSPDRAAVWDRPTSPGTRLSEGAALGRFRIEKLLGRGGMGEVWKAFDPTCEGPVVIKVLPPELQGNTLEIARLRESFKRVHVLQHQHICPVHELVDDPKCGQYLVMKYLPGQTLAHYRHDHAARHGSFPLREVIRVLRPIADALDYAHGQRVIHRDIKPQNILINADGSDPQLVDFGLAAEIQRSMARVSLVRADASGTLPYMAPEQWQCRQQDARTDQYALAAVAYELLTDHPPFDGVDMDVLRRSVLHDPVAVGHGLADHVNTAFARALAKDPNDRYDNCATFLRCLDAPQRFDPRDAKVRATPNVAAPPPRRRLDSVATLLLLTATVAGLYWFRDLFLPSAAPPPVPTAPVASSAVPPTNPPPTPTAPAKTETPVTAPEPIKVRAVPTFTAEQQQTTVQELRKQVSDAAREPTYWVKKLTELPQPVSNAETDILYKQLRASRPVLQEYAAAYQALDAELDAKPPTNATQREQFDERLRAVAQRPAGAETLAALLERVGRDHATLARTDNQLREQLGERRAALHQRLRKDGLAAVEVMEAAYTGGFHLNKPEFKETWGKLTKCRQDLQGYVEALTLLMKETSTALHLDPPRLDALEKRLDLAAKQLPRPLDVLRSEGVHVVQEIGRLVAVERTRFAQRKKQLTEAHEEAQWFICTDDNGKGIAVALSDRPKLCTNGKAPWIYDNGSERVYLDRHRQQASGNHFPAPKQIYFDERGQPREVLICTYGVDDNNKPDLIARKYANPPEASWKFAIYSGRFRQQFVPYDAAKPEKIAQKQAEMTKVLASILNARFPGLNLTPDEISIIWRTTEGDQKEVTLANTFGAFKIEVKQPATLPPGLTGQADTDYRAAIDQTRKLFAENADAPKK